MQKSKKMRKSKYSPSYGPYGIWIPLFEEAGSLPLETSSIVINDEEILFEITDAIERAKGKKVSKDGPSAEEYRPARNETSEEAEQQNNYYRKMLINSVGKVNTIALDFILTNYATQKAYFNGVLRESEKLPDWAIQVNEFGKNVEALRKSLCDLEQNGLLDQAGLNEQHFKQLKSLLPFVEQIQGSLEKDLPDLDSKLRVALFDWWQDVTGKDVSLWSYKDTQLGDKNVSPFLRFTTAALKALPEDLRPDESKGTPGFSRNAMQRQKEALDEKNQGYARLQDLLAKLSAKQQK